jgi:hypothetical protein
MNTPRSMCFLRTARASHSPIAKNLWSHQTCAVLLRLQILEITRLKFHEWFLMTVESLLARRTLGHGRCDFPIFSLIQSDYLGAVDILDLECSVHHSIPSIYRERSVCSERGGYINPSLPSSILSSSLPLYSKFSKNWLRTAGCSLRRLRCSPSLF